MIIQCCLHIGLLLFLVAFVQIRLSQERDYKMLPLKWRISLNGNGTALEVRESSRIKILDKIHFEGNPPLNEALSFTLKDSCRVHVVSYISGTPLSFHRIILKFDEDHIFREMNIFVDMNGEGIAEMTDIYEFNPKNAIRMEHRYNNNLNQDGKSTASVTITLGNI